VLVYFGFLPRNFLGRWIFSLGRSPFRSKFFRVIKNIEGEIKEEKKNQKTDTDNSVMSQFVQKMGNPKSRNKMDTLKIRDISYQIEALDSVNTSVLKTFIDYIYTAPDSSLYRMRPRGLAEKLKVDEIDLLTVMLHATRKGLINMSWDIICPHCQGVRERAEHLWQVNKSASCEACQIDFDTTDINSLEISFHISPYIKKVERIFYCSAEPAKKPHIKYQKKLSPGANAVFQIQDKGRYRMRVKGQKNISYWMLCPKKKSKPFHGILKKIRHPLRLVLVPSSLFITKKMWILPL